jgi:hypothetical protein
MYSSIFLGLLAVASPIFAQQVYTIDPETVSISLRTKWCSDQMVQCPLICLQLPGVTDRNPEDNNCDAETLDYSCVCSNGVAPNITEFSQTIPFYQCQEWGNQCVKACGNENTCATECREKHPCGAQTPKLANKTTSSATLSTASSTSGPTSANFAGFAGQTAAPKSNDKGAASSLNIGQSYGFAILAAGLFAGFALVL